MGIITRSCGNKSESFKKAETVSGFDSGDESRRCLKQQRGIFDAASLYLQSSWNPMMFIILGDGVVANRKPQQVRNEVQELSRSTLAWGPCGSGTGIYLRRSFGCVPSTRRSPIALAVEGSFAWSMVPGYVIAQLAGAICRRIDCLPALQRDSLTLQKIRNKAWRILYRSIDPEHWIKHFKRSSRYIYPRFRDQRYRQCNRTFHRC